MKIQEMKEVNILVTANATGIRNNPESFLVYGTDMLSPEQKKKFTELLDMELIRIFKK